MTDARIFIADDDTDDWLILKEAMQQCGAEQYLSFVLDGKELVEHLNTGFAAGRLPELIILDLNMPKITGSQTLQLIKNDERFKHIPVIIYSTSVNQLEKKKCIALGAADYITKPNTHAESISIARYFLTYCNQ